MHQRTSPLLFLSFLLLQAVLTTTENLRMAIITTNTTCISENQVSIKTSSLFSSIIQNWDAHRIGWTIACGCAVIIVFFLWARELHSGRKFLNVFSAEAPDLNKRLKARLEGGTDIPPGRSYGICHQISGAEFCIIQVDDILAWGYRDRPDDIKNDTKVPPLLPRCDCAVSHGGDPLEHMMEHLFVSAQPEVLPSREKLRKLQDFVSGVEDAVVWHLSKPDPETTPLTQRTWAVVIGIEHYLEGAHLRGCAADAKLILEYLTVDLHVPRSNITLITDCDGDTLPTRDNIVNALYGLCENPHIKPGDNIIVYFSGYGARYTQTIGSSGPDSKPGHRFITAICPRDREISERKQVPDISLREFDAIVSQIADAKGSHITVILDCSFCAEGLRCQDQTNAQPVDVTRLMLDQANKHPQRSRNAPPISFRSSWVPPAQSFARLSACKDNDEACRTYVDCVESWHGVFTWALIHTLRNPEVKNNLTTTYQEVCERLLWLDSSQVAQASGTLIDSPLWFRTQ